MSDEKKPKRLQSQTERDFEGLEARRERERSPVPFGVPKEVPEEITGQYEDEELVEMRARRPVADRLNRLEQKHDEFRDQVDKRLNSVEVAVAHVGGQMEVIPRLVDAMEDATKALQQREHMTFTARVDVDKARELDTVAAKADKRKLWLKVVGIFGSGGLVFELLHRTGVL